MRVALLVTCVVDLVDPDVAVATADVLAAGGCDVSSPAGQTCCGQPAWNAGFAAEAAAVAATTLAALAGALDDGADAVVVPSGSCAAMVRRSWPELFAEHGTPDQAATAQRVADRTWELTEVLPHLDLPPLRCEPPVRVAWHHGCHLLRELGQDAAPEALAAVDGATPVAWSAAQRCCGFGGLFSTTLPEVSVAMADDKLTSLAEAKPPADLLASSDPSCLLHLAGRMAVETPVQVPTRHVAQLLRDALPRRGEP